MHRVEAVKRGLAASLSVAAVLFGLSLPSQAQELAWVSSLGGLDDDSGRDIAADMSGNLYVTGSFEGEAAFGATHLASSGGSDVYLVRYDASGQMAWAVQAGGTRSDRGEGIGVDGSGNVYVTGSFSGDAVFGGTLLSSRGSQDVFVAKFDPAGNALWAVRAGGPSFDQGLSIAVDPAGEACVTGSFILDADFGGTRLSSRSTQFDIFLAKVDPEGNVLWAKGLGGASEDVGAGVAVSGDGSIFLTGHFSGVAAFDGITLTAAGPQAAFLARFDAAGDVLWASGAGGQAFTRGRAVSVDAAGRACITGFFQADATFDGTTLVSAGRNDLFVARYDAQGRAVWATSAGGPGDDNGVGIGWDGEEIHVAGSFHDVATFGSFQVAAEGSSDAFVARYGADGVPVSVTRAGGTGGDSAADVALLDGGGTALTGTYRGTAGFPGSSLFSAGMTDVFVARFVGTEDGPQNPLEGARSLLEAVRGVVESGALKAGPGKGLEAKLLAAIRKLEAEHRTAAAGVFGAFLNQVEALQRNGALPTEIATDLTSRTDAILDALMESGPAALKPAPIAGAAGLAQAAPNPFNPTTTISYRIAEDAEVRLVIYNPLGQEICRLVDGRRGPGVHKVVWDGRDGDGRPVASGTYLVRLQAGALVQQQKLALVK